MCDKDGSIQPSFSIVQNPWPTNGFQSGVELNTHVQTRIDNLCARKAKAYIGEMRVKSISVFGFKGKFFYKYCSCFIFHFKRSLFNLLVESKRKALQDMIKCQYWFQTVIFFISLLKILYLYWCTST